MTQITEGQGWVATTAEGGRALAALDRVRAAADADDQSGADILGDRLRAIETLVPAAAEEIDALLVAAGRAPSLQPGEDPVSLGVEQALMALGQRAGLYRVDGERDPEMLRAALAEIARDAARLQSDLSRLEAELEKS